MKRSGTISWQIVIFYHGCGSYHSVIPKIGGISVAYTISGYGITLLAVTVVKAPITANLLMANQTALEPPQCMGILAPVMERHPQKSRSALLRCEAEARD